MDRLTAYVYRCVCINPNGSWRVAKTWEWEFVSPWALITERETDINTLRVYMKVRTRHEAKHLSYCRREPKRGVPIPWMPPEVQIPF